MTSKILVIVLPTYKRVRYFDNISLGSILIYTSKVRNCVRSVNGFQRLILLSIIMRRSQRGILQQVPGLSMVRISLTGKQLKAHTFGCMVFLVVVKPFLAPQLSKMSAKPVLISREQQWLTSISTLMRPQGVKKCYAQFSYSCLDLG